MPPGRRDPKPSEPAVVALGVAFLAVLLFALHAPALWLPFLSDDYASLAHRREGLVASLAHAYTDDLSYNFRPVGRELYFWMFSVGGNHPAVFHAANFAVLVGILALVVLVGRQIGGLRAGLLAAGVYALAYPHRVLIGYASCSQDVVAALLALLATLLYLRGRPWWSAAAFFLAMLSKESVVTLPLVLLVWEAWAARSRGAWRWGEAFALTRPLWIGAAAWALIALAPRLGFSNLRAQPGRVPIVDVPLSPHEFWGGLRLTLLTYFYLDQPWRFVQNGLAQVPRAIPAIALAALFPLAAWFVRPRTADPAPPRAAAAKPDWRLLVLGLLWCTLGALPVAFVGHRFSGYYVCVAGIGFGFAAGALLARTPAWMGAAAFTVAAVLNVAANGSGVFRIHEDDRDAPAGVSVNSFARLETEGRYVDLLHDFLKLHPPPRGAVIYFSQPFGYNLMGTGGEHAPRVWFDDPTLRIRVMRSYVPAAEAGPVMFVRYDENPQRFSLLLEPLAASIVAGENAMREGNAVAARMHIGHALDLVTPQTSTVMQAELQSSLGLADDRLGNTVAARASWLRALELNPANRSALINLTALAMDAGNYDEARQWTARALALDPHDPMALEYAARIQQAQGR